METKSQNNNMYIQFFFDLICIWILLFKQANINKQKLMNEYK